MPAQGPEHEAVVVGAGFAGIGLAIALKRAGIENFILLEKAADIGGTWRDNTYPGLAVDIPAFTYSFGFAPRADWSRLYPSGREIKQYADGVVKQFRLRPHLRLNSTVTGAKFDETSDMWHVSLADGAELTCRFLLSCQGALSTPSVPALDGLDDFRGHVMHTARWDHDHDLRGARVAVVGTGATALQLVPEIAEVSAHLTVFQRTPIWVFPKFNPPIPRPLQALIRAFPALHRALRLVTTAFVEALVTGVVHHRRFKPMVDVVERLSLLHLRAQVPDRKLRAKLRPRYGFGCKRPSFSNDYWRTFTRAHVDLVTSGIDRITPDGVLDRDGVEHPADTLILATGFKLFDISFPIIGRDGGELSDFWSRHRRQAYEGVAVPGFPNLFLVPGPYGNVGLSWFQMIDVVVPHVVRVLNEARRRRASCVEVRQDAHDRYMAWVTSRMPDTVFFNGNCASANSYYFDEHGDAPWLRPTNTAPAKRRSRNFPLDDYAYSEASTTTR
ncbi:flavin-containing monooxygenase [Actinomadura gamaensis]|uniref:Flavin-containing monooxygenase n=1 Tax=Actinomadura gamaensis TaxID=1763541 RepID=A0ABV9U4B3_9ACTN